MHLCLLQKCVWWKLEGCSSICLVSRRCSRYSFSILPKAIVRFRGNERYLSMVDSSKSILSHVWYIFLQWSWGGLDIMLTIRLRIRSDLVLKRCWGYRRFPVFSVERPFNDFAWLFCRRASRPSIHNCFMSPSCTVFFKEEVRWF